MDKPCLSVIVASYKSRRTIPACLNSLRQQDFPGRFEVIVVDSSNDETADLVRTEFPDVSLICCSMRRFPGDARNLGIDRARGEVICFLDSDCVASPNWLSEVWRAHSCADPVVGGCISNGATAGLVGWASYFAEFSIWLPGTPSRRLRDVPGCNVSFKRWIMDELGPLAAGVWSEDTIYNWKLRQAGYPWPLFEPSIAVTHHGITNFRRFLTHQFELGRAYGWIRASMERFGPVNRLAYAMAVPLIHLILCARVAKRIIRSRQHLREFVQASPLVILGLLVWSVGEAYGTCGHGGKREPDALCPEHLNSPTT